MTAEAALVLPALVIVAAVLLWGLMAAAAQIRCVDAARAGARAAARGEADDGVRKAVRTAAPAGAVVETAREGELLRVRVKAKSAGPGPLAVELGADAVALAESGVPGG
ncbi:TadE family type IV pilus minor pilin [Streptomyces xiaopingdaonensis]|uniref:TadE family type IV pilus minor pilin n=1 Tax=Streptomyces xiaopingdaonensis TaxID=1565415 RepID=UPI0003136E72|nr:TadE family type IV pilus minor pilin [Streptomyces xiaopingdaonensis]